MSLPITSNLSRNNPAIILVAPQMGENIGAAARVMKNFDFNDLRIVSPRDGWPNSRAEAMAVGGIDILKRAKIYENLNSAIGDLEYLFATTAALRDMNKNYVSVKHLRNNYPQGFTKVGILFGRENCGLTNEEISHANVILSIGTSAELSSLNLAQAVAIICYELFEREYSSVKNNVQTLCNKTQLEYFYKQLFEKLECKNFFKVKEKKDHMILNIKNIFNRIDNLSVNEVQTIHGIIKALSDE